MGARSGGSAPCRLRASARPTKPWSVSRWWQGGVWVAAVGRGASCSLQHQQPRLIHARPSPRLASPPRRWRRPSVS